MVEIILMGIYNIRLDSGNGGMDDGRVIIY